MDRSWRVWNSTGSVRASLELHWIGQGESGTPLDRSWQLSCNGISKMTPNMRCVVRARIVRARVVSQSIVVSIAVVFGRLSSSVTTPCIPDLAVQAFGSSDALSVHFPAPSTTKLCPLSLSNHARPRCQLVSRHHTPVMASACVSYHGLH